jgi:2-iminobutanoate/2-iminopropanoate deaminase
MMYFQEVLMPVSYLHTSKAPRPIGPYSQAAAAGRFVFTSGQLGLDPATGQLVPGGVEAEATQALANLRQVLIAGGAGFEDAVSTVIYLIDLADFKAVNAIYEKAMGGARPARATVQAAALPLGARIEIAMIACLSV